MPTQIELLKKYGLSIRGFSGQHLLIDPNLQRKIVDLLDLKEGERVLEIGPGLGALTREILQRKAKLWAVEKDERFVKILVEELKTLATGRFEIFHADILKFDLEKLFSGKTVDKNKKWKVISNLPYYITAPILFRLMDHRAIISKAVLTMQKEVAARLIASPGTKDYGRLTLAVRYLADVEHAFDIHPTCFTPQPEVDSSVVLLTFHPPLKSTGKIDEKFLFQLIQIAFSQRRKTLLSLLGHDKKIGADREKILQVFKDLGWTATVRGEELLLKDFLKLAEMLRI